jgi:hypothetical protein
VSKLLLDLEIKCLPLNALASVAMLDNVQPSPNCISQIQDAHSRDAEELGKHLVAVEYRTRCFWSRHFNDMQCSLGSLYDDTPKFPTERILGSGPTPISE